MELVADPAGADDHPEVLLASGERISCPSGSLLPLAETLGAREVLEVARGFLGSPYVWGGIGRSGIDCSGLVHVSARIAGRCVPRDAHHQWASMRVGVSWDALQPGDLLFFGERADLAGIDHVGFHAGDGLMLHAPEEGRSVVLEPISERARARAVGVGRLPGA